MSAYVSFLLSLCIWFWECSSITPLTFSESLFVTPAMSVAIVRRTMFIRRKAVSDFVYHAVCRQADHVETVEPKWCELHQHTFRSAGLSWPPLLALRYPERILQNLMQLPERCREIIAYSDAINPAPEEGHDEVLDVSQSIDRLPRCKDAVPAICPKSVLWSRARGRCILANEKLALQGWPMMTREDFADFPTHVLDDLAGNAFNGQNIAAIVLAALTRYDWPVV